MKGASSRSLLAKVFHKQKKSNNDDNDMPEPAAETKNELLNGQTSRGTLNDTPAGKSSYYSSKQTSGELRNVSDALETQQSEHVDNDNNTQIEEALVKSYHEAQEKQHAEMTSGGDTAPLHSPQTNSISLPRIIRPFWEVVEAIRVAAMVIYWVFYGLFFVLYALLRALSALGRPGVRVNQRTTPLGIEDNPFIALLLFPITILIYLGKGLAKMNSGGRKYPGSSRSAGYLKSSPSSSSSSVPRVFGSRSGRPCRCKDCVIL